RIINNVIKSLREEGKAVVVVTHDSDFALSIADEVLVMREGLLLVHSTPSKILLNEDMLEKFELEPPSCIQQEAFVRDIQ
ncbi:MAG: hypothetical protein QXP88_01550, partial [Thermoproteota archaeon]